MADVTISQLTVGVPSGSALLPFSTGSNTLGVPVSAIFQNTLRVGIGTTFPETVLDLVRTSDTAERAIRIQNSATNLLIGVEGVVANRFVGSTANNIFLGTTTPGAGIELATDNTVRMAVSNNGNVGIGTITPSTKLDVNGTIRSSDGMPYNQRNVGSVTTDASGNARVELSTWYWVDAASYQRAMLVMFGIKNSSIQYIGSFLSWFSGAGAIQLASSSTLRDLGQRGVISFKNNSNTGTRWIDLAALPASTTFDYEIRSVAVGAGFISSYGDF